MPIGSREVADAAVLHDIGDFAAGEQRQQAGVFLRDEGSDRAIRTERAMTFELTAAFLTGIEELDAQHQELISRINAVEKLEKSKDIPGLLGTLAEFKSDLADHFRAEEAHLRSVNYPKLSSHAKHHSETIVALERLIRDVEDHEPSQGGIAHVCFHELISAVLLTDMQFINWMADHPELRSQ